MPVCPYRVRKKRGFLLVRQDDAEAERLAEI